MMSKKERISHAMTGWLPLSAVAAGTVLMVGPLLNLSPVKIATAAIASCIITFSAFPTRSYAKEGENELVSSGRTSS
jgi:hypothetical protein